MCAFATVGGGGPYLSFQPQSLSEPSVEVGIKVMLCSAFTDATVLRYRAGFRQGCLITNPEFPFDSMKVLSIKILESPSRREQCR